MAQEYPDYEILEVVAAGPKQYAIMMRNKKDGSIKYILKIRGITFDKHNEEKLSYEKFKNMVLDYFSPTKSQDKILFTYNSLRPDKLSNVHTKAVSKYYRPVNTKGVIRDFKLFPFGFSQE